MTNMIALITGANKGIGLATARQLGGLGMTVLVGARNAERGQAAERELRTGGADARFVPLDVTDAASVAAAVKLVEEEYGRLDVLVNNAGIILGDGARALPSETTLATLRRVYETNVFGVVAVTNAVLPLLRRAPAGRIVNVSSEVGSITTMTDPESFLAPLTSVPYPSSKTALNMVTAMYAKELRDTPIKVNAANPGYCATDLNGNSGFRSPDQGAEVSVHLATLPADGPTGQLWGHLADGDGGYGVLPW
ncbi:SDR family oxidoreductase [Micromonospora sp. NPDC048909]|uniref:SDR family oxidoreductase n=1 Tax=Micromonospora sp. NPDC048909 TaxID=3155643 RepID=UPI0033CA1326